MYILLDFFLNLNYHLNPFQHTTNLQQICCMLKKVNRFTKLFICELCSPLPYIIFKPFPTCRHIFPHLQQMTSVNLVNVVQVIMKHVQNIELNDLKTIVCCKGDKCCLHQEKCYCAIEQL